MIDIDEIAKAHL